MESDFIKERTVVREQLIKKNLAKARSSKSNSKSVAEDPPQSVIVFEEVVNENLKQELVDLSIRADTICQTITDYLKVKSALKIFKSNSKDVRVQTNIGCNFYAQCEIEDASSIYLCIGQDYFLSLGLDEAIKMIDLKEKQWTRELDLVQQKASKIKAYIKIALEAIGRIYDLDRDKLAQ